MFLAEGIMSISIKLLESNAQISRKINKAIGQEVNKIFDRGSKRVAGRLRNLIPIWVNESPEIQSLRADGIPNTLNAEFGLDRGTSDISVEAISLAIAQSIDFKITPFKRSLEKVNIQFFVQPKTFENLLGLPQGFSTTFFGQKLHWMDWLLKQGTRTIVFGYEYQPGNAGRSGGGVMVGGGFWRISPQFAGTETNNFITRMFANKDRELTKLLEGIFDGK